MEPNEAAPIEQAPLPKPERSGDGAPSSAEQAPPSQERLASTGDRSAQGGPPSSTLPSPQITETPVVGSVPQPNPTSAEQISGPAIADEVDVIEKEWVDKAKNIVNTYRHDPYNQEKAVGELKVDYKSKRYGKDSKRAA